MEKVIDILESLANEKGLPLNTVINSFKEALNKTAQQSSSDTTRFDIDINLDKKIYKIEQVTTIVDDNYEIPEEEEDSFLTVTDALEIYNLDLEVGDEIRKEIKLEEKGRTASFNLFNNLQYQIQREVENTLFHKYHSKIGSLINGIVTRIDKDENTFVEIDELKGRLSKRNRIKGETFKKGDTLQAILRFVNIDPTFGIFLELTRTSPKFLEKLMSNEVPEISDGIVKIMASARIPGQRAKIALKSESPTIDPVGAAVGVKGVRINAVTNELSEENIDCIEHSIIPEIFISRSLSPAVVKNITIEKGREDKRAIVDITSDQKSRAIGKNGINIKLVSMLTGYNILLNDVEGIIDDGYRSSNKIEKEKKYNNTDKLERSF